MQIKRKPILFSFCLIALLCSLVAVDRIVTNLVAQGQVKALTVTTRSYTGVVARVLDQARNALASLDTLGVASCDLSARSALTDTVMSVSTVKNLMILSADGATICATMPLPVTPLSRSTDPAASVGPGERLDFVKLGQTDRLALRLTHASANAPAVLAAIMPLSDIAALLFPGSDRSSRNSVQAGIGIGLQLPEDLFGARHPDVSVPHSTPEDGVDEVPLAPSAPDRIAATVTNPSYPVSIWLSIERPAVAVFDPVRLAIDIPIGIALFALLALYFFRRPVQEFGNARFDLALRRREFEISYRPIIDLSSGKPAGAIAEPEWHRGGGVVLPWGDFAQAVIRSGMEAQILRYILMKCQSDLAQAYKLRPRLVLKVAIDHETLLRHGFVDQLRRGLAASKLRASQLVLGIAPFGELSISAPYLTVLKELQQLGVQFEIKQSTGEVTLGPASSEISANLVGIDIRLVKALESKSPVSIERAKAWIAEIVETCRTTGVRVCAYRVGNASAVRQLKMLGVQDVEGEILSPALSSGMFMALVTRAGLDHSTGDGSGANGGPVRRSASF